MCISMVRIFSIQIIRKSGTTLLSLQNLTVLRTVPVANYKGELYNLAVQYVHIQ